MITSPGCANLGQNGSKRVIHGAETTFEEHRADVCHAVQRLEEITLEPVDTIVGDATVPRFEFTFEAV
ncbi:MAG: hypothetical protein ACLFTT_08675 [Candidatus Hydrogenedentota bacterium]